jgi:putative addiction module component (TIGR02574 family)
MTAPLQTLGIDRMSVEDRIALATAIWDTIATEPHPPFLTEVQRQELDRRRAEHSSRPEDVIPWENIKAEALTRFRQ